MGVDVLAGGDRFTCTQRLFLAAGGAKDELTGSLVRELALSLSGLWGCDACQEVTGGLEHPQAETDWSVWLPKLTDLLSSSNAITSSGMPSTSLACPDRRSSEAMEAASRDFPFLSVRVFPVLRINQQA
jgi:hypothetical protein